MCVVVTTLENVPSIAFLGVSNGVSLRTSATSAALSISAKCKIAASYSGVN
jgi:hypothetical protein